MERVIEYARDNAWLIGPNPVKNVDRPALEFKPDPFENWETVFEIARAFDTIGFRVGGHITRFAAGLGLRPQEVLVARECDVDRPAQTFGVLRTWDDTRRIEVELRKTSASGATLNLTAIAAEVIGELPEAIHRDPTKWHVSPLLFSRPDGARITPDYFRNKWADALATLPHVSYKPPKRLRDTFGTLTLLELGLDQIKTVSTLMRHTSEKVTLQHYAKIVQELRLKAACDASRGMPAFGVGASAALPRTPSPISASRAR
jgi:integrase